MLFFCAAFILSLAQAVDRSKFNNCQQTSFCQRNRYSARDTYTVNASIKKTTKGSIQLTISQKNMTNPLIVCVHAIENGKIRFTIREATPGRRLRYESPIGNILVQDPPTQELTYSADKKTAKIFLGGSEVVRVSYSPFFMEVYDNGRHIATVNGRQKLLYETINRIQQKSTPGYLSRFISLFRSIISFNSLRTPPNTIPDPSDSDSTEPEESPEESEDILEGDPKDSHDKSVGVDIMLHGYSYAYGLPERGSPLALKSSKRGDPYRLFNLDVFQYDVDDYSMALYGSVPLTILHGQRSTAALFWLNSAETWVDLDYESSGSIDLHWFSETGIIDFFVLLGPSPVQVFKQYAELTGTSPIPPLFALGFHQSRWNYNDEEDVQQVSANFEKHGIPLDVIWLDIEHTDERRYFTWRKDKFGDPTTMLAKLAAKGRKLVAIVDPHLKRSQDYSVYASAREHGYLVRNADGNVFEGWCWPGHSTWPDFTCPKVREWWASLFSFDTYIGSNTDLHVWVDMNEPSVFSHPEMTLPRDALHCDDIEHRELHNEYGSLMARATWEGLLSRTNHTLRPFLLGRAFFAGSQRYGAYWTGDNEASWTHLQRSIPMILSMSISGITFAGADVGGFFGNPDGELIVRWHQLGAWQPFFRSHAHIDSRRREPWLFEDQYLMGIREAINTRYSYLPYWYTLFANASIGGFPPMAPLWVHFPRDLNTFTLEQSFMIGTDILVCPVLSPSATKVKVYLPGNQIWYNAIDASPIKSPVFISVTVGLMTVPTFYRGGSIIPRRHWHRRSASLSVNDPISLTVSLDENGNADGVLYVDDYTTFNYTHNNMFDLRKFSFHENILTNTRSFPTNYTSNLWIDVIYINGLTSRHTTAQVEHDGGNIVEHKLTRSVSYYKNASVIIRKPGVLVSANWTIRLK